MWHIPGGTVRFGEPLTDAVKRVAAGELGLEIAGGDLLGYIEYPSHLRVSWDWPVGIAFAARLASPAPDGQWPEDDLASRGARWFERLPDNMHQEQKEFFASHAIPS
jgi:ADP-ribose pyrophosphatase YjhB (NUDIX family)